MAKRVPLQDFIRYGHWFLRQADLPVDSRVVSYIELAWGGFRLVFEDGKSLETERVVVATGIASFAHIPKPFTDLPCSLVSHTSYHKTQEFCKKAILEIAADKALCESAVLLDEAGAHVEVLVRRPLMRCWSEEHRWMLGEMCRYGTLLTCREAGAGAMTTSIRRWPPRFAICLEHASSCSSREARAGNLASDVRSARAEGERVRVELNDGSERVRSCAPWNGIPSRHRTLSVSVAASSERDRAR